MTRGPASVDEDVACPGDPPPTLEQSLGRAAAAAVKLRTDITNREAGYEPGARASTSKTEGTVTARTVPRPPRPSEGSQTDA